MNRLALSAVLLFAFGCSRSVTRPDRTLEESGQNRELFLSAVGSSYRYFYQNECFCDPETITPVQVEVLNGAIQSVVIRADGTPVAAERWGRYLTVLEVFATIESALGGGADAVQVTYDDQLGYPRDVHIDYAERVGIDDVGFSINNLSVIRE